MAAKFVLKKGSTGKFRFNLVATNGQVIATSEAYESKASAINGIESVKRNAPPLRSTTRPTSRLCFRSTRRLPRPWHARPADPLPGREDRTGAPQASATGRDRSPPVHGVRTRRAGR
jgi:uncharacterized protein YegP (UPF0339 family)